MFTYHQLKAHRRLLALFGEQFARQFISESVTWLDHIIFAMAPLGIITAINGAIRVSGPPWARAFVGRARENRAASEIELMSSTSREVCEVFNGKGVVRAMGTPRLMEFLVFPSHCSSDDPTCGIHTLRTAYESEPQLLENGTLSVCPQDKKVKEAVKKPQDVVSLVGLRAATQAHDPKKGVDPSNSFNQRRRKPWNRHKYRAADVETGHITGIPSVDKQVKYRPPFPRELVGSAPNFQLNLPKSLSSYRSTVRELWFAAAAGIVIQITVVLISTITLHHPSVKTVIGEPKSKYGFWLFIAGTLCLNMGMFLCAWVIDQNTRDLVWRKPTIPGLAPVPNKEDSHNNQFHLFWLQQGHTVNDQKFDPYLILGGLKREMLTSSRISHSRYNPLKYHILTKWICKVAANRYEFLSMFSSFLRMAGFILQFEGMRDLTWPTAVSQLVATLAMAFVRAIVRRRLGQPLSTIPASERHELDCELEACIPRTSEAFLINLAGLSLHLVYQ
jgi:hypothetical protein